MDVVMMDLDGDPATRRDRHVASGRRRCGLAFVPAGRTPCPTCGCTDDDRCPMGMRR